MRLLAHRELLLEVVASPLLLRFPALVICFLLNSLLTATEVLLLELLLATLCLPLLVLQTLTLQALRVQLSVVLTLLKSALVVIVLRVSGESDKEDSESGRSHSTPLSKDDAGFMLSRIVGLSEAPVLAFQRTVS